MRESGPEHAGAAIIFSRPPVTFLATKLTTDRYQIILLCDRGIT